MAVLPVQSRVAYGRVGNRAAVFPLGPLGFDVRPINTVQLLNHTGYGSWRGDDLYCLDAVMGDREGDIPSIVALRCTSRKITISGRISSPASMSASTVICGVAPSPRRGSSSVRPARRTC